VVPVVAAVAALLLVAGIVVFAERGGSSSGTKPTASKPAPAVPVKVASASPYGGPAGGGEHPEEAALAVDGSAATKWYTQHYATAAFGQLRPGTGLMFDLGRRVTVRTLTLRLAVAGVKAQVHAGDSTAGLLSARTVGSAGDAPSTWTLHPDVTARYWLVWFTRLAPDDGGFRAGVAEASFSR
jgi:hypothetical protein